MYPFSCRTGLMIAADASSYLLVCMASRALVSEHGWSSSHTVSVQLRDFETSLLIAVYRYLKDVVTILCC